MQGLAPQRLRHHPGPDVGRMEFGAIYPRDRRAAGISPGPGPRTQCPCRDLGIAIRHARRLPRGASAQRSGIDEPARNNRLYPLASVLILAGQSEEPALLGVAQLCPGTRCGRSTDPPRRTEIQSSARRRWRRHSVRALSPTALTNPHPCADMPEAASLAQYPCSGIGGVPASAVTAVMQFRGLAGLSQTAS
ncbi:hypothetical protein GGR40_003904 [Novosphingobium gossypii]